MAKKKKKSVLDYDPLAWLNESTSENADSSGETSDKKIKKPVSKAKKAATKKAVTKKVVTKKNVSAKKTPKKVSKKVQVKSEVKTPKIEEDEGFGFFTDVATSPVESNEAEDGFGFFTNTDDVNKQEEPSEDEGFGFFTDVPSSDNVLNDISEEEQGFGFFTNDNDAIETVNMETLDISKDDAINLGSELTIKTVSEVKDQISHLLALDEDIVMNAEEMIKIDTAGLQLLFSLKKTLSQTGHHIKWIGTSTVINDSAEIIGMPILAPKSKDACFGFFEENMAPKDAEDGSSGFF